MGLFTLFQFLIIGWSASKMQNLQMNSLSLESKSLQLWKWDPGRPKGNQFPRTINTKTNVHMIYQAIVEHQDLWAVQETNIDVKTIFRDKLIFFCEHSHNNPAIRLTTGHRMACISTKFCRSFEDTMIGINEGFFIANGIPKSIKNRRLNCAFSMTWKCTVISGQNIQNTSTN